MITKFEWLLFSFIFILLAGLGYAGYRYNILAKDLAQSHAVVKDLQTKLANSETERSNLAGNLQVEQGRNNLFADQIDQISGQVGTLTKLSQTDKELLQKYSKIYFLSDNYVPSQLTSIDSSYVKDKSQELEIHTKVWPYLQKLLQASANNRVPLLIASAYRSFGEQSDLKATYKITYGAGSANSFSADQGYSEHQLGTTVDFSTATSTSATFEQTTADKWLIKNAYKYGFVLSYPKQNKYYVYEPWHWRFVGVALATKLHNENKYFYELDQREIDQYLVSIFD